MHHGHYVRLFADERGESHFEEIVVDLEPAAFAPPAAPLHIEQHRQWLSAPPFRMGQADALDVGGLMTPSLAGSLTVPSEPDEEWVVDPQIRAGLPAPRFCRRTSPRYQLMDVTVRVLAPRFPGVPIRPW
jgi:hypothetical protein